jgi:hypothetical protein
VKYSSASAFRSALESRLKNEQSEGVGVARLRKRVVFERLLARLQAVAPEGWFLKGGFALELRLGGKARTTKDVDIDWTLGEQEATELLLDAAAHEMDDLFTFTVQRSTADEDPAVVDGAGPSVPCSRDASSNASRSTSASASHRSSRPR